MDIGGVRLPDRYNGIGLHDTPGAYTATWPYDQSCNHAELLKDHGVTLYKVFSNGSNKSERVRAYVDRGVLPIVRPWIPNPWGRGLPVPLPVDLKPYMDVGCQLLELGNEWNIVSEWYQDDIPGPEGIAIEVCNWWEECLERAAQIPGMIPLFPSNTPGGNVDHRLCYPAIRAELVRRGLLGTVTHVAVHPRPHNNPPDTVWTLRNTVTFDEWRWIRDNFQPSAYYWATEHGYSLNDDQNHDYPRIDLEKWTNYSWELQVRMDPAHPQAIEPGLAGHMHWFEAGWGHWGGWAKDAIRDSPAPEMPAPSPLWVKMGQYPQSLEFQRYGEEPPEPPITEPAKGIDVSYYQNKGIDWAAAWSAGNRFAFLRASNGLTADSALWGHYDQARYHAPEMLLGLYHFLSGSWDGKRQASMLYALWLSLDTELPPVVDVESASLVGKSQIVHEFINQWLGLTGSYPMVYTSASKWEQIVGAGAEWASPCPLWVAHYNVQEPTLPDIWDRWEFWQTGVKLGPEYPTAIDRDLFNGTDAQLADKYGDDGPEPPEPPDDQPEIHVTHQDGGPYINGNYPGGGVEMTRTDPWGNVETVMTGSKPEYGYPGGFIVSAPVVTTYTLEAEGWTWEVVTQAGHVAVCTWTE